MNSLAPFIEANPIWLAPMAGVTDKAFRTVCLRHGAGLTYTEMVSAKALEYANDRTWHLVEPAPEEQHIAVQLFGHEPDVMARQAVAVAEGLGDRLALIDVNMGCPVLKVHKKGEGSALMKTPGLASQIISSMAKALEPYGVPVTAKFRSGWDAQNINAIEFARVLEDAGAAALAVHGRTAKQMYTGQADWDIVAQVVGAVEVPVFGSGDVWSHADALAMMERTSVKAVMAARGSRGNPWIFDGHEPSTSQRIDAAREHLGLYMEFYGCEHLSPLRAQLAWYVHGQAGATALRRNLGKCVTQADFESLLDQAQNLARQEDEGVNPRQLVVEG